MCDPIPVALEEEEYRHAALAGFGRQCANVLAALPSKSGGASIEDGYDEHIVGAVGEFVVAKALGIFWPGPGTLKAADLGAGIQVRSTHYHTGRLRVHDYDADEDIFVLVTGKRLHYQVRGWLYGREAKEEQDWWTAPDHKRFAFFVPQTSLQAMSELKKLLRSRSL